MYEYEDTRFFAASSWDRKVCLCISLHTLGNNPALFTLDPGPKT
jgi:hypothetical protein